MSDVVLVGVENNGTYISEEATNDSSTAVLGKSKSIQVRFCTCESRRAYGHVEPPYATTLSIHKSSAIPHSGWNITHLFVFLVEHGDDENQDRCNTALQHS